MVNDLTKRCKFLTLQKQWSTSSDLKGWTNVIFVFNLKISCRTLQKLKYFFLADGKILLIFVVQNSCSLFANFVAAGNLFLLHIQIYFSSSELYGNTGYVSSKISIITLSGFLRPQNILLCLDNLQHWSDQCIVLRDVCSLCSHENLWSNIYMLILLYFVVKRMTNLKTFSPITFCVS